MTASILVAEKFHKSYGKVLRDIDKLSCSQEFRQANFGLTSYSDSQGKVQPMYYITKDGFSFLASDIMVEMPGNGRLPLIELMDLIPF
jgi:Rha family phage regulatory protein